MNRQQVYIFVAEDTLELEVKINDFIDRHKSTVVKTKVDSSGIEKYITVSCRPRVVNQSITTNGKKFISQLLVEYDCD